MSAHENAAKQWPNAICSGPIRYGKADNYDGFYLADAAHGIPTFASVADASPATIRSQHVRVFNYPGQTEAIAAQLVERWNAYDTLRAENERLRAALFEELDHIRHDVRWAAGGRELERAMAREQAVEAALAEAQP